MKKYKLLIIILIISISVFAQTDFRPGYVVKTVGDTLFGEIDYRGDKKMSEICRYRVNNKSKVTSFQPGEIYGFRFIDSKYFVSKNVNGSSVFL